MSDNPYLRLISGNETITIPACKGGEKANIYNAKETFLGYIDSNFDIFYDRYIINQPQPTTEKTEVKVYEMYNKDADFNTLFGSLGSDLKSLAFESQQQIEIFCKKNKQWLRKDGYATLFLFVEKVSGENKFFVAYVTLCSDGRLNVYINGFPRTTQWYAGHNYRIVVSATKISEPKS